jgi:hypothetical protein
MLEQIKNFLRSLVFLDFKQQPEVRKEPVVNIPKDIKVEPPPAKTTAGQRRTRKPKQNGTSKKQSK